MPSNKNDKKTLKKHCTKIVFRGKNHEILYNLEISLERLNAIYRFELYYTKKNACLYSTIVYHLNSLREPSHLL